MNNKYSVGILAGALAVSSVTAVAIQVGKPYAKAMINGKWHIARSQLKIEIPPLNCGT